MALKAKQLTVKDRVEFDAGWPDVAWTIMLLLDRLSFTDFDAAPGSSTSIMEIFGASTVIAVLHPDSALVLPRRGSSTGTGVSSACSLA